MNPSVRVSGYDLFKLIVALILLILFFLFLRRGIPQAPVATITPLTPTDITSVTSTVVPSVSLTPTPNPAHTKVNSTSSPTSAPTTSALPTDTHQIEPKPSLTLTPIPSPLLTQTPALEPTLSPTPTPIPSPVPTQTPGLEPTPPVIPGTPSNTVACDTATSRSRLQVGDKATILRRLNFRSSPGIQNNWILTNMPGTQVEVIGGPTCLQYYLGAYVWWEIRLPDGREGWSAESSQLGSFYFMEPTR